MDYYKYLSQYFFSDWIMILITIIAFIVSIKHWNENRELNLITYYIGASVAIDLLCIYFELFIIGKFWILSILIIIFIIVEITIFFIYLSRAINSTKLKIVIKAIYISFFILVSYLVSIRPIIFNNLVSGIAVIESFCLVFPCLFYFYELFTSRHIVLENQPSFWVVTGIFFYNSCSIPIFLLTDYLNHKLIIDNSVVLALNYILYSILFLLFIKAYLCRKKAISL